MKDSRFNRCSIAAILAAYLVTGVLSPTTLLGQALFVKLENSFSVQNERSIVLDERPYWTSHKHLIASEQFTSDQILSTAEPWITVVAPERSAVVCKAFLPLPSFLSPSNDLRAPPLRSLNFHS